MVGLSVRYHDVSIALITCHMASDQHGKSRLVMRNRVRRPVIRSAPHSTHTTLSTTPSPQTHTQDARRSLKELALQWDSDFDVHHTHHHST